MLSAQQTAGRYKQSPPPPPHTRTPTRTHSRTHTHTHTHHAFTKLQQSGGRSNGKAANRDRTQHDRWSVCFEAEGLKNKRHIRNDRQRTVVSLVVSNKVTLKPPSLYTIYERFLHCSQRYVRDTWRRAVHTHTSLSFTLVLNKNTDT
jgi:hypothetical protein